MSLPLTRYGRRHVWRNARNATRAMPQTNNVRPPPSRHARRTPRQKCDHAMSSITGEASVTLAGSARLRSRRCCARAPRCAARAAHAKANHATCRSIWHMPPPVANHASHAHAREERRVTKQQPRRTRYARALMSHYATLLLKTARFRRLRHATKGSRIQKRYVEKCAWWSQDDRGSAQGVAMATGNIHAARARTSRQRRKVVRRRGILRCHINGQPPCHVTALFRGIRAELSRG